MRKHNSGHSTHSHSKTVARPDSGYRHMNGRLSGKSHSVSRPDITYSTGGGRSEAGNNTFKNKA